MTSILRDTPPTYEELNPTNICSICKFPPGKFTNNQTEDKRFIRFFRKAQNGKYICDICVEEGRGIPVAKMSKKEKKKWKKMKRSLYA